MKVFWDVDTQWDFMMASGKLSVPNAEVIIPNLSELTYYAIENNITILGSADRHFEDDEELEQFGPHCMGGTAGQKKLGVTTLKPMTFVESKIAPYGKYME